MPLQPIIYIIIFVSLKHGCLPHTDPTLGPSNSGIKRLWCSSFPLKMGTLSCISLLWKHPQEYQNNFDQLPTTFPLRPQQN